MARTIRLYRVSEDGAAHRPPAPSSDIRTRPASQVGAPPGHCRPRTLHRSRIAVCSSASGLRLPCGVRKRSSWLGRGSAFRRSRTCARARPRTLAPTRAATARRRERSRLFPSMPGLRLSNIYDAAVSGADPIETPAGLPRAARPDRGRWRANRSDRRREPVRARLITQELGVLSLIKRRVRVLTAAGDDLTATDDPFKKAMRRIAGASPSLRRRAWSPAPPRARAHPQREGQVRGPQDAC